MLLRISPPIRSIGDTEVLSIPWPALSCLGRDLILLLPICREAVSSAFKLYCIIEFRAPYIIYLGLLNYLVTDFVILG